MSKQKDKLHHIDDMDRHLRQAEALTMTLECADLHNPSARELNGIFSLLNEQIRKIQNSLNQYVEIQGGR